MTTAVIPNVLDAIISLLEGGESGNRVPTTNEFIHWNHDQEDIGNLAASSRVHPFVVRWLGLADDGSDEAFVSGNFVMQAHSVRLTVVFLERINDTLGLEDEMAEADFTIRKTLEYPENFELVSGWVNCSIAGITQEVGTIENENIVQVNYDLVITTRERHQ